MLEIPSKWVDIEDPLMGLGWRVREAFQKKLGQAVAELIEKGFKLPKPENITPAEVKARMLQIMAERALEELPLPDSKEEIKK